MPGNLRSETRTIARPVRMPRHKSYLRSCAAILILAAGFTTPAKADLLTGLSTTGSLSGWTSYGNVSVQNTTQAMDMNHTIYTLTPASGAYMAAISPGMGITGSVDAMLRLKMGSINTVLANNTGGNKATDFGILTQTTYLSAGTYTFCWSYAAQDAAPFNDGVLFSLASSDLNDISDVVVLASNGPSGAQSSTLVVGGDTVTQWATYSFTIATSGTYTTGFAAYNWSDAFTDPIFYVSAFAGNVTSKYVISTLTNSSVIGSGAVEFAGGMLFSTTSGTISNDFSLDQTRGNGIDAAGKTVAFSGVLSGAGGMTFSDSVGGGTIILTGINTYTGTTTIASGTLEVGDASHRTATLASSVTIANDAVLAGHGTISGMVTNTSGGTVRPGGSIGTLTVGSYAQGPGSTLAIAIDNTGSSRLAVTGTATLDGTLSAIFGQPATSQATYKVLTASSISGTFSNLSVTGGTSGMIYGLYYAPTGTEVDLVATSRSAGQIYGDITTADIDTAHSFNTIALEHTAENTCVKTAADGSTSRNAACGPWSFWSQGLTGTSHVSASNGAMAFNARNWGAIGGVDLLLEDGISLHGILGYNAGTLSLHGSSDISHNRGVYLSLATHIPFQTFRIDASAFYLNNINHVTRTTEGSSVMHGQADNKIGGLSAQFTYPLFHGDVTPQAKITYGYVFSNPISESEADGQELAADYHLRKTGRFDLGVRLGHEYMLGDDFLLRPQMTIGVQYDADAYASRTTLRLANITGSTYDAPIAVANKLAGIFRAGIDARLREDFSLQAGIDGRLSGDQHQMLFRLGADYQF